MLFLILPQWNEAGCPGTFVKQKQSVMALKKTIAVIGATGNMGVALSKSLAKGNYRLLLTGLMAIIQMALSNILKT